MASWPKHAASPPTRTVVVVRPHGARRAYWHFPSITRNGFGGGTLTCEATLVTDALQREIVREALSRSESVRVRHGRNTRGERLNYGFINVIDLPCTI